MDVNPWKATDDCRAAVAALIARDTRLAPDDEATRALASAIDAAGRGATVVALMPARTGTVWWHTAVMAAAQVRPVRGRVRFGNSPFPSAVVVFRPQPQDDLRLTAMDARPRRAIPEPSPN